MAGLLVYALFTASRGAWFSTAAGCLAALLLGLLLGLFAPLALAALCVMAVLVVVGLVIGFNNK